MRIAVFAPNLIGDTVMATPTLRALRAGFPSAEIAVVIKPHVAPTLDASPWVDRIIPHAPKAKDRQHRTAAVIRRLRADRFDLAVLLPNSFRSALSQGSRASLAESATPEAAEAFSSPIASSLRRMLAAGSSRRRSSNTTYRSPGTSAARSNPFAWNCSRPQVTKRQPMPPGIGSDSRPIARSSASTRAERSAPQKAGRTATSPSWPADWSMRPGRASWSSAGRASATRRARSWRRPITAES